MAKIRIFFDGPPEAISGRFIEVEDENGKSIDIGEWKKGIRKKDHPAFWYLEIETENFQEENKILRNVCTRLIEFHLLYQEEHKKLNLDLLKTAENLDLDIEIIQV